MNSTHTPRNSSTSSIGVPQAPRGSKPAGKGTENLSTPKGSTRIGAKRVATDFLDRIDDIAVAASLADILTLARALVNDNFLLKTELAEIKTLLHELISSKSSSTVLSSTVGPERISTYASVMKENKKVVVINPSSDNLNPDTTRNTIKAKLKPSNYKICGLTSTKKGGVVVECPSSAERDKLKADADSQLGDDFAVTTPGRKRPRIRVFGFCENFNAVDLVKVLKDQNPELMTGCTYISVAHVFKGKTNPRFDDKFGAKLEVDSRTFHKIMSAGKLFVGWASCHVSEDLNIRRCFKCWGFNHISSKCLESLQRCPKCCGNHHQNECDSSIEKCAVCYDAASKLHLKIDTNHIVFSDACPSYIHRVNQERRRIDYGGE